MTSDLITQIKAIFNASLKTTFVGGLFFGVAPVGTNTPFLVVNIQQYPIDSRYGGAAMGQPEIQFTAWDIGNQALTPPEQSLARIEAVIAVFDASLLNGAAFYWRRTCSAISAPGSPMKGNNEYGWLVRYAYATTS